MQLTKLSLGNPVAVIVAVLLAIIFGLLSRERLPIQLTPEVETPEITINTQWRAAAPQEVEAEIIEPQEKVFRGLPGMTELLSQAKQGSGSVTITFAVGTNLERALLEVLNRLNRVPRYPDDAEEPVISTIGGDSRPIAWFIAKPIEGNDRPISTYQDFLEEVVQTRFERVQGVALSEVRGGREREVRVSFDPYRAASLGVQLPVAATLAGSGKDVSAGDTYVGKRRYTIRFAGKYDVDKLGEMILEWRDGKPIQLRDVADIELRYVDRNSFVIQNSEPAMAINAHRETGVNVLEVMQGLREAVTELREGPLKRAGLTLTQVYDETKYIDRSINMVLTNLVLGICLAIGVLWWFLRRFRATLMVALAIPISVITSFILLDAADRTLNVISLAGLAFAVGMVLDAAIIVLENIVRLREEGEDPGTASYHGTVQVWGALLASTATTVAIFLPVVFLEDETGQLFADLALTIAVAICFSLVTAVTVLPTAAQQWLKGAMAVDPHTKWWDGISNGIMGLTRTPKLRAIWIVALISTPLILAMVLKPKIDYLPQGNRNLVFAFILAPPGSNIDFIEREMGQVVASRMLPYIKGEKDPHVNDYFFVAFGNRVFMGARTKNDEDTDKLVPLINRVVQGFPGTIAFAKRTSLFGKFGAGRSIDVNIQARNVESLLTAAQTGFGMISSKMAGSKVRPFPGLELAEPELQLIPDERRLAEVGWNRATMAGVVRAVGDGLYVGDYFDGDQRLDIILRSQEWSLPEELQSIPLATPAGGVIPLSELVSVVRTAGPDELRRLNRRRTITLQVTPPDNMPLEEAIDFMKQEIEPALTNMLPEDGEVTYSGTADKLGIAIKNMGSSFLLAVIILYLLMSALFRSFKDSLLVILAIPLATVGGVISLQVINLITFQPMDLLTMIGFIILLGLVVNNAILLVHQTRTAEREGLARRDAVQQAVRMRLRPILMSTLTSIFGMLPLLLMPGAGTELYRGLAGVIVGGMCVSTVFTLILLPSLLRIGEDDTKGETQAATVPAHS
ncbi:efflux RND transporter permease subunit [Kaarinaea lacus]